MWLSALLVFVVLQAYSSDAARSVTSCPKRYRWVGDDSCVRFVSKQMMWHEAVEYCESQNATLAAIEDKQKADLLGSMLIRMNQKNDGNGFDFKYQVNTWGSFWIAGFRDRTKGDTWYWYEPRNPSKRGGRNYKEIKYWAYTQEMSYFDDSPQEDCLYLSTFEKEWGDTSCVNPFMGAVCEAKPIIRTIG